MASCSVFDSGDVCRSAGVPNRGRRGRRAQRMALSSLEVVSELMRRVRRVERRQSSRWENVKVASRFFEGDC